LFYVVFYAPVFGQLRMTKKIVAKVLAQKVIDGRFTMEQAKEYALRLFYTNLMEFYGLTTKE